MKQIALLIFLIVFPQLSETIYTPSLPAVAKGLSASVHAVEGTLAIYFIGFALGVLVWGIISDTVGRRPTMLAGIGIYVASSLFCAAAPSVETLLFWRLIQAFGASVGSVITVTILRDTVQGEERAKIFALISAAFSFSPAIGPLLGGLISEWAGWRMNFWALVALGLFLFLWSFLSLPETRPAHIRRGKIARQMFSSPKLWGHILLIGAGNGMIFSFYEEAPFLFIDRFGIAPSLYGLIGIVIASATILAAQISYRYVKRHSAEKMIGWGSLLALVGGLGFPLGMVGTIFFLFLSFIGIGLVLPNSISIALKEYEHAAGTAGSLFGGVYYLMVALFTWGMGFLHDGTAWPLPLYLTFLALILVLGHQLIAGGERLTKREITSPATNPPT